MGFVSMLLLALGLSADATACAATLGIRVPQLRAAQLASVAAWFGGSQGLMALLGSYFGHAFGSALSAWDHWIAFVLLAALGGKMLWEALWLQEGESSASGSELRSRSMFVLALATSVDALAVGVTLPLLEVDVAVACGLIALVTALMSVLGLWAGRRFGALFGRRVDALGGLLLLALGIKILTEHLNAA